jgi:hypothetical protein
MLRRNTAFQVVSRDVVQERGVARDLLGSYLSSCILYKAGEPPPTEVTGTFDPLKRYI